MTSTLQWCYRLGKTLKTVGSRVGFPQFQSPLTPDIAMTPKDPDAPSERWRLLYRMRVLLMVPLFYVMAFCTWRQYGNDLVVFTVGPGIFLAGLLIRIWAHMHLRYRLKAKTTLTSTGPYRHVRNPLYIGNTLILAGVCFTSRVIWFVPVVAAYCAVLYSFVVRYEESHLTGKYGETCLAYLRTVPRWMPRLAPGTPDQPSRARQFLVASIAAEVRNLLLFVIPVAKEFLTGP